MFSYVEASKRIQDKFSLKINTEIKKGGNRSWQYSVSKRPVITRSFQRVQNSWEWVSAGAVAPWAFCILWSTMEPGGIALSGEKMGEI